MTLSPREALSVRQTERLRDWLRAEYASHLRHELFAALVFAFLGAIAHAVAFFLTTYIVGSWAGGAIIFGGDPWLFLLIPGLILAAMYPVYWWLHRTPAIEVALPSGVVRVRSRRMQPSKLFEGEGPGVETFWLNWMLFPVWMVACCITHIEAVFHATRADKWAMARVLAFLYEHNRRISVLDLDISLREPGLPAALRALELEPGVLFYTENDLSVVLNDELAARILEASETGAGG